MRHAVVTITGAELEELRQALIADAVNERRLLDSGYFVGDQRKAQDLEGNGDH